MRQFVIGVLLAASLALPAAAASPAHPAETPAEKWLNTLINDDFGPIQINTSFSEKLKFTAITPPKSPLRGLGFSDILTKPLFDAIKAKEVETVKDACKGAYIDGELCGMEYSPFLCGQDVASDPLLFHSVAASEDSALIDYWSDVDQVVVGRYRLVKDKDRWKIDGIHCVDLAAFNFKDENP